MLTPWRLHSAAFGRFLIGSQWLRVTSGGRRVALLGRGVVRDEAGNSRRRRLDNAVSESPVENLLAFGQSPWLDFIQCKLLETGEVERVIAECWGLRGVT